MGFVVVWRPETNGETEGGRNEKAPVKKKGVLGQQAEKKKWGMANGGVDKGKHGAVLRRAVKNQDIFSLLLEANRYVVMFSFSPKPEGSKQKVTLWGSEKNSFSTGRAVGETLGGTKKKSVLAPGRG